MKIELEGHIILHDEGMHNDSIEISDTLQGRYGIYDGEPAVMLDEVISSKLDVLDPDEWKNWRRFTFPRCRITIEVLED